MSTSFQPNGKILVGIRAAAAQRQDMLHRYILVHKSGGVGMGGHAILLSPCLYLRCRKALSTSRMGWSLRCTYKCVLLMLCATD